MNIEVLVEGRHCCPDLSTTRLASHTKMSSGVPKAECLNEGLGQTGVIVLAGMDHVRRRAEDPNQVGEFDDLGSRAKHDGNRTWGKCGLAMGGH